ncbi:helix-turn-helix domain-containing protein [Serratia sp. CY74737]|uniref:helix-turn-helix domain-containing protein n=1 Tax=Serratia sp. CY74737 TaxID=3383677 RepID=UPI003F9FBFE7
MNTVNLKLTERERDILIYLSFGMDSSDIGRFLGIHRKTVSYYKKKIMKDLGFRNTASLLTWLRTERAKELICCR